MPFFRSVLLSCLFFLFSPLWGQFVPEQNWRQMETEHFLVIFPEKLSDQAVHAAGLAETAYVRYTRDYPLVRRKPWPLILTSSGVISNGFVSLIPSRSVWYGTPTGNDMTTLDWYELLALHETRHIKQFEYLNRRTNRFLYFLAGEPGLAAGIFLGVPDWFFEGDAVYAETEYSESGRGRDPVFFSQMEAIAELNKGEQFSYAKMVNRSYDDFVPNQYVLGYLMYAYILREYGAEGWEKILKTAATVPVPSFGFYLGAKIVTGKSWKTLYQEMMAGLKTHSQNTSVMRNPDLEFWTDTDKKDYQTIQPVFCRDEEVIVLRTSFNSLPELILLNREGGETYLTKVPAGSQVTAAGTTAVWTYEHGNELYPYLNWSDLIRYNWESGEKVRLTEKKRYFDPVFNHGGDKLAVFEWNECRQGFLVVLDGATGSVEDRIPLPTGTYGGDPAWSSDDKTLFLTLQGHEGRRIAGFSLHERIFFFVTESGTETVKGLRVWDKYLFYSSNRNGDEALYARDLDRGSLYRITGGGYGVSHPYPSDNIEKKLFFSLHASVQGEKLVSQDLHPDQWMLCEPESFPEKPYPYEPEKQIPFENLSPEEPIQTGEICPYSPFSGLLNIHSWGFYPDLETGTGLAFQVASTDLLNSWNWSLGGEMDINEKAKGAFFKLDWQRYYPVISWNNQYWYRKIDGADWNDLSSQIRFSFPLNFYRDILQIGMTPYFGGSLSSLTEAEGGNTSSLDFPLHYGLLWYIYEPGGYRSLNPPLGMIQKLYFNHTPFQKTLYLASGNTVFYLPGGFSNTSLSFQAGWEQQTGEYQSRLLFARGYTAEKNNNIGKFSCDYEFPLFYPDAALGSWMFIKRMRGTFFYDQTSFLDGVKTVEDHRSLGVELNWDLTFLNMKYGEFSLGLRYSWLLDDESPSIQILFMSVDL